MNIALQYELVAHILQHPFGVPHHGLVTWTGQLVAIGSDASSKDVENEFDRV
jgi:hypothetical protein